MTERMSEQDWPRKKPQRTTIVARNDRLLWLGINREVSTRELVVLSSTVSGEVTFVITHRDGEAIKAERRALINIPIERVEYMLSNDMLRIINENDPEGNNHG